MRVVRLIFLLIVAFSGTMVSGAELILSTNAVRLQKGTASFSQTYVGNYFPEFAIDGNREGLEGWAIYPEIGNQTAVFETSMNVAQAGERLLQLQLHFGHYSPPPATAHTLGRFRISVTSDNRDFFADGLPSGGDVSANWTVLEPLSAVSSAGATLSILEDHSVLASGTLSHLDTYTIALRNTLSSITGIRLEALTDPSLPFNGPGREPWNGNFVLSEIELGIVSNSFAPLIVEEPRSVTVTNGGNVSFAVAVRSAGPVHYQWSFNGAPMRSGTNATLNLGAVQAEQAGTYTVEVSNEFGRSLSGGAVLNVDPGTGGGRVLLANQGTGIDAPVFDPYGHLLSGAEFLAQLYAGTSVENLSPVGPAVPFRTGTHAGYFAAQEIVVPETAPGASVTVAVRAWQAAAGFSYEMAVADRGLYGGSEPIVITLGGTGAATPLTGLESFALLGKPIITSEPAGGRFMPGESATLTTGAEGSKPFTVQWFKDNALLAGATNASLVFTNLAVSDTGSYHAVISNLLGSAKSAAAVLVVTEVDLRAPVVTITSPTAASTESSGAVLGGKVTDNLGVARVEWEWNGVPRGELTLNAGVFELPVTLTRGVNRFVVRAIDPTGNSGAAEVSVLLLSAREIFIGQTAAARDGTILTVPLFLRSKGEVSGGTIVLGYPRDYLAEPKWSWAHGDKGISEINTNMPGQIRATFALSGSSLAAGTNPLATVTFRVRSVPNNVQPLLLTQLQGIFGVDGQPLPNETEMRGGAVQLLRRNYTGDNNGNDLLDVGDASVLMRMVSLLEPIRSWDVPLNDLNRNLQLDAGDVIRVLRTVVDLDPQPGASVQALAVPATGSPLSLAADTLTPVAHQKLVVKVRLDSGSAVNGASFAISYPTNALWLPNAEAIRLGGAAPASALSLWNLEPAQNDFGAQSGVLRFAISSSTTWPSSTGNLLELSFEVLPSAALQKEFNVVLSEATLTDGRAVETHGNSTLSLVAHNAVPASFSSTRLLPNGAFEVRAGADPGLSYTVESSDDLRTWTRRGMATNQQGLITFSEELVGSRRFYRLRQGQ